MSRGVKFTAASAACVAVLWASNASASKWMVGFDGEYVHTFPKEDILDGMNGAGFHVRTGYQLELLLVYVRPEIGGSATFFDEADQTDWRAYGGGRVGLLTGLSPAVYGHVGYGWFDSRGEDNGFTADLGLALDITILPFISAGGHASFVFNPDEIDNWITAGLHAEVLF